MRLPIHFDHNDFQLDAGAARSFAGPLAARYAEAQPFPHVVIDNFLPDALVEQLLRDFPQPGDSNHSTFNIGYMGTLKRQYLPEACSPFSRQFFRFLNSQPFLAFLETLTGHEGLIGDPHFEGGGFHETLPTGKLGIHADFRISKRLNLLRRVNFLLYLNPVWDARFGGDLELWDRAMQARVSSIAPTLNRCVIFTTDATSFHGHPEPLRSPEGTTRRSIATYYYTASSHIWSEVAKNRTNFVARPDEASSIKWTLRMAHWKNRFRHVLRGR